MLPKASCMPIFMTAYVTVSLATRGIHKGRDCLNTFKPIEQVKCKQNYKMSIIILSVNGLITQLKLTVK